MPPLPFSSLPFTSLVEALAWLDAHVDFESNVPSRRALPTLDRMRELARFLGDPERAYPSVHLTGTNGKGSTAAMVTALLGAAGLRVGTYTSPNLSRVNERLSLGGQPIGDEAFTRVLGELAALEPMLSDRPTRFELLTAAALGWFAEEAVGAAVVEVGLGGTWDCTNVVDAAVAVLTNVSFDHTEVLGPTLEGIARDKAGIAKAGSTVVVGETDPGLVDIVRQVADAAGAGEIWVRGVAFDCTANRLAVGGRLVDLRTPGATYGELLVPLHGPHQGRNAACALAAVEAFFGSPLGEEVVAEGFAAVRVPGRLEVVGRRPLCMVDGAHNVAGMEALAEALADGFLGTAGVGLGPHAPEEPAIGEPRSGRPGGPGSTAGVGLGGSTGARGEGLAATGAAHGGAAAPVGSAGAGGASGAGGDRVAVVGMLRGRDPSAMLAPLRAAGIGTVVACAPASPRALPAEVVAEAARALGLEVAVAGSVAEAVVQGRSLVDADGLLVVAGSLYVVADARTLLLEGAPSSPAPPAG